jgi:hypothetical protein
VSNGEPTLDQAALPSELGKPVIVNLTRRDLLTFNLFITPRLRGTWIVWTTLILIFVLVQLLAAESPVTTTVVVANAIAAVIGATAVLLVGLVIPLVFVLVSSSTANGVLGQHTYSFQNDGLRERTEANDTLLKWGGARDIRRIGPFILIGVAPALFHVLPRRCFASSTEYDAFWGQAQRLKSKVAAQQAVAADGRTPS